jgi:hypothetical protein
VLSSFAKFLQQNLRLSKSGFYPYSIVSFLAVPLAIAWGANRENWLTTVLIALVLTAATFAIYLGFLSLQRALGWSENLACSLSIIIATGAIRGWLLYFALGYFDYTQLASALQRVLNSAFTTLIWLGLANLIVEVNRRYRRRFRAILSQLLVVNLRNSGSAQAGFAVIAHDLALLQTRLEESYSAVKESSEDSTSMSIAATEIRTQIESALKPLSKRLWLNSLYEFPKLKLSRLLSDAISNLNYPFIPILLMLTLSAFVNLSPASGFIYSTVTAISQFFAFILIEFGRRLIISKFPNLKQSMNLIFVLTVGAITGSFSALTLILFNGTGSFFLSLLFAPYLSALVLVGSTIRLALSDRREILDNLSKGARRLTLSSNDSLQSSQAASYLHNSLQSELTALAHEFELVAENPDKNKSKAVLEKLDSLIRRSMGEDFANFLESPEIRLDRVLASWNGIVTLKTSIDRALFSDPARGNLFVQLVEESLANSVRKGQATEVEIKATFIGTRLEIEINDNGVFDKSSKPGLGSAWLERYAVGESKFNATESGTRLSVEL